MNHVTVTNPAELLEAYPPTLPIEIALGIDTPQAVCKAHGIDKDRFARLLQNPAFLTDLKIAREAVRKEGMSFKLKARIQADELLGTAWTMVHDPLVPPSVRADLIKTIWRAAGLDGQKDAVDKPGTALQININL